MILSVCMYCKTVYDSKPGGDGLSHGYCPACESLVTLWMDAGEWPSADDVLAAREIGDVSYRTIGADDGPVCQRRER